MMKMLRAGLSALVLGLVGCGDGGVQSPDFTPVLAALTLSSDPTATQPDPTDPAPTPGDTRQLLPLGRAVELTTLGLFTTPPGSDPALLSRPSAASFTVEPASAGTVVDGMLVGMNIGNLSVTAARSGVTSNTLRFRVTEAVLDSIAITPASATISINETQMFTAAGTFSDGMQRPLVVAWSISDPSIATVNPPTGQRTTVTPAQSALGSQTQVVATATSGDGRVVSGMATLIVSDEFLVGLTGLRPAAATVAPNATVEFVAEGTFSNGTSSRSGDVGDGLLLWASADPAIATIDANGVATGLTAGQQTTVSATIRPAVTTPGGSLRSVSGTLTVSDARCTGPLLAAEGATTSVDVGALCVLCSANNADNVIDGAIDTFGTLNVTLGLLTLGTVTLNVDAAPAAAPFAPGPRAGFVVALPPGLLATAELVSSLTVGTRLDGVAAEAAGANTLTPLRLTLLGVVGGQDAALVSFPTTQPYDGIALTFNSGVASLLPSINVFQACATAVDTTTP